LSATQNIIRVIKPRMMSWVGHRASIGEMRNAYKILVGKPEGKRSFGRYGCRQKDDVRMNVREVVWEDVD